MFQKLKKSVALLAVLVGVSASFPAMASIVIKGTRVVYPAADKEVTVRMDNPGKLPVLVQSWIDNGDPSAAPETIRVPFALTPPITRVDPGKGQTLRISFLGEKLPVDKESVYWLNILEVPARQASQAKENYLQLSFRTRIKLFYRPSGLAGSANEAYQSLQWKVKGNVLQAFNPSPYFVSLATVVVNGKKIEGKMIAPGEQQEFNLTLKPGDAIAGTYVNDYGAVREFKAVSR